MILSWFGTFLLSHILSIGMIIPNIWDNKIHVPNHQPVMDRLQSAFQLPLSKLSSKENLTHHKSATPRQVASPGIWTRRGSVQIRSPTIPGSKERIAQLWAIGHSARNLLRRSDHSDQTLWLHGTICSLRTFSMISIDCGWSWTTEHKTNLPCSKGDLQFHQLGHHALTARCRTPRLRAGLD